MLRMHAAPPPVTTPQDLLTDEPFVKKDDVVVLQDPGNPSLRDVNRFYYIVHREARLDVRASRAHP